MKRTVLQDHRYRAFALRYRHDALRFAIEVVGAKLTWQQITLLRHVSRPGCRVSVASGHGTGKSFTAAIIIWWHQTVYPHATLMITAPNLNQVQTVIWKELHRVRAMIRSRFSWLTDYWEIKETTFYCKGHKKTWSAFGKTASKGNPEGLAGQHGDNYMVIADEGSGIDDIHYGVITGAFTHHANRFLILSQPTRQEGYFYDTHHDLKGDEDKLEDGTFVALQFNSEESPLVSLKFIKEKLRQYRGSHSPDYQIKVQGRFPDNLSGMLLSKHLCELATRTKVQHAESWGYVATADVGGGVERDSSVLTIAKVSGWGDQRTVEPVWCQEMPPGMGAKEFAREIAAITRGYENISIGVDAAGIGLATLQECEELGLNVTGIYWGGPPFATQDRKEYLNLRAYANVAAKNAIIDERLSLLPAKKLIEQASRIPYKINERGQWVMMSKEQMRAKGIKSPDMWDTICFFFLMDFIPVRQGAVADADAGYLAQMQKLMAEG